MTLRDGIWSNRHMRYFILLSSLVLSCSTVLYPTTSSLAVAAERDDAVSLHNEVPDDPYVASPRAEHARSTATRFGTGSFFAVQVNVDEFGQNIVGDAANEPSIAVDPTNPDKMVIGWRQFDTITSNFRQAGYGYTTDGGLNWTFPGVIEPGVFRSDPVLDSDSDGNFYYNSLTLSGGDYLCSVYRSDEPDAPWDFGTPARGGDKQWMVIDKSGGAGDGNIYAYWNGFYSSCPPGFFTRSTNGGDSYENCTLIPDDPYWGTLNVSSNGTLYTVGAYFDDFIVGRSSNAQFGGSITWEQSNVVSLGGSVQVGTGPNPEGLLGQACVSTLPGSGPGNETVFVLCSVDPPGADPLDVKFARSTDGGVTWGSPVRINDDTGSNWQWFGTMSVSPSGRIDVIWLDTRDNPGTLMSSLYYSSSEDGGVTWSANERLSTAFDPQLGWPQQAKMGDYFHMVSDDSGFRLAWTATFNGEEDVYFGRMLLSTTDVAEGTPQPMVLLRSTPNPFAGVSTLHYEVPRDAFVTLEVYDASGRNVATLVSEHRAAGSYHAEFDGTDLPDGVYMCRLQAGDFEDAQKLQHLR
ncbi:MAG: T9SS type A sorting domain-containing protein [Candidatus Eisenbacteria bacterium]